MIQNYRILRVNGIYGGKESLIINNAFEFAESKYSEILDQLVKKGSVYSNGFVESMKLLNNEPHDIFFDVELLQKLWATENNIKYNSDNWQGKILLSQIKHIKPEVVYITANQLCKFGRFDSNRPKDNIISIIKDLCPFVKLIAVFSGSFGPFNRVLNADILFASIPKIESYYRKAGLSPILLYHSFDHMLIETKDVLSAEPIIDFSFTGMVPFGYGNHSQHLRRYDFLSELMKKTNLELWINEFNIDSSKYDNEGIRLNRKHRWKQSIIYQLIIIIKSGFTFSKIKNLIKKTLGKKSANFGMTNRYKQKRNPKPSLRFLYSNRTHKPVFGLKMYEILSQSKIVFNIHGDLIQREVGNMRMFEATGVGTCLLTDTGINMTDLFEADKEIVTYSSVDEAVEKVNYLLANEKERKKLAEAGQKRTLKDHTIFNRCQQIDESIRSHL